MHPATLDAKNCGLPLKPSWREHWDTRQQWSQGSNLWANGKRIGNGSKNDKREGKRGSRSNKSYLAWGRAHLFERHSCQEIILRWSACGLRHKVCADFLSVKNEIWLLLFWYVHTEVSVGKFHWWLHFKEISNACDADQASRDCLH